jgi:hypothetical protein
MNRAITSWFSSVNDQNVHNLERQRNLLEWVL